ncbi:hypothetical protein MACH05_03140 [Qipengyuania nanhaisediminis]
MALAIILVPYMLAMLGPERYGLWLILQLFNLLGLASLAELGFQGAIVRYLARYHANGDRAAFRAMLASGFKLFAAIGAVMAAATIALAQTEFARLFPISAENAEEMRRALTVVGAGLLAGFPALMVKAYFAARQELAVAKIWELADRLVFALGTFVLLQLTTDLVALVLFEQVVALVLALAFACVAWREGTGWFAVRAPLPRAEDLRGVVAMSGSVFGANAVSQGFNRLPELFVGAILGPVTLTAYQLATRIPRVIKTLQGSLNAAVLPHIARLDAGGAGDEREARGASDEARRAFALQGLRANYLVAMPLLVASALLAPVLLELWVGAAYRPLAGYLVAFTGFQALFLASNYCSATLTRHSHFRLFVRANCAIGAAFVVALSIGLERWGLGFVFAALLVSGTAMFACVLLVFRLAHGADPGVLFRTALAGPVVLSGALGVVLLAPGAWWLAKGVWLPGFAAYALGGAVYLGAIVRLVLTDVERGWLAALIIQRWKRAR